jgi:hypothetical protein
MNSKSISKWKKFEELSRKVMSKYFGVQLKERSLNDFPKKFDMVSDNGDIVGDAKFLTLVHRKRLPPAKFMEIAGHVWLLEKVNAKRRFLVFGNQEEVPQLWLKRYGNLVHNVEFYFIDDKGNMKVLSG